MAGQPSLLAILILSNPLETNPLNPTQPLAKQGSAVAAADILGSKHCQKLDNYHSHNLGTTPNKFGKFTQYEEYHPP
jgi:hypothetical protein